MIFKSLLFLVFLSISSNVLAVTEFTITVKSSGGDQTSLSAAESIADEDLTAADIKVFSISAATTPTLADGDTVLGQTSGATGVCVHVNAARTQVLIKTIALFTFQSGEVVQKTADAGVTVTLSNAGDSPIVGIALYAMQDTTAVTVDDSTTNATNYVRIYASSGQEAVMPYSVAIYRLEVSGTALTILDGYTRVNNIQIKETDTSAGAKTIVNTSTGANNSILNGLLMMSAGGSAATTCFYNNGTSASVNVRNSVCDLSGLTSGYGFRGNASTGGLYLYNNTAIGGQYGFYRSGWDIRCYNCLASGQATAGFTAMNLGSNYNASSDGTATYGANSRINQTFTFVNAAGGDYHLASTDAGALRYGIDLTSDGTFPMTDDFDRTSRVAPWDIGADECLSCVTAVPVFMHHYFQLMGE